jgi:hypothetical protein
MSDMMMESLNYRLLLQCHNSHAFPTGPIELFIIFCNLTFGGADKGRQVCG